MVAPYYGFARHISLLAANYVNGEIWKFVDTMESVDADMTNRMLINF